MVYMETEFGTLVDESTWETILWSPKLAGVLLTPQNVFDEEANNDELIGGDCPHT